MILRIILFNELEDFLPQGGVRRRPKKVPPLAAGRPPGGPPEAMVRAKK